MDLLRSLPLGLYLEQPVTWLHRIDPRVKFAWLMTFLVTPLLATLEWRMGLVLALVLLTLPTRIPWRVWRQQMGWIAFFCFLVLAITAVMPDGLAVRYSPRLPTQEIQFAQSPPPVLQTSSGQRRPWYDPLGWSRPEASAPQTPTPTPLPQPTDYRYTLFYAGPVTITRRSLQLGVRLGTGFFTLIYSTTLFLLTTAPEEITAALEQLMQPLKRWRLPITEIGLTLTLSLRFIPLVLEEIQNLVRSVRTRAINWKKLGVRGAAQIWLTLCDRLLENLFLRAEQIASAMNVRGFTSPSEHQVQWHQLKMHTRDWVSLGLLGLLLAVRIALGVEVS